MNNACIFCITAAAGTEISKYYFLFLSIFKNKIKSLQYFNNTVFLKEILLYQAYTYCKIFLTADFL